ncbi:MAG: guanylate kinase [Rickettsiales bacterium]|jgi:guanylate kinase|nr:guanylate kinase [Rickettsiales bacterium]
MIFVISAPTNGGKNTVMAEILRRIPDLAHVVTTNSRPPRANEIDGVDYHFISSDEFQRKISAGDFIEWALVHNDFKGVQKKSIFEDISRDRDIIIQLDVQGFQNIKRTLVQNSAEYKVIGIFLEPPSIAVLKERWALRGDMQDASDVEKRLADAEIEMEQRFSYDFIVMNDDLAKCEGEVERIIRDNMTRPRDGELF